MTEISITAEMWYELLRRVSKLEQDGFSEVRLGPTPEHKSELAKDREELVKKILEQAPKLVDRSARQLVSGKPVPEDYSHTEDRGDGQQKDYVVLTAEERSKGWARPYRDAYRHLKCGKITTMGRAIAETYARDFSFYTGTYCSTCHAHFPIGEDGEFVWYEMDGSTGPKVGT